MRNNRFALNAGVVAVAAAVVMGGSACWYRDIQTRAHELERQNASLLSGYDEIRGFAIECLVREGQSLLATSTANR